MAHIDNFTSLQVPFQPEEPVRPRLSITADILSYRRCSKQYGRFSHDGFQSSQAAQIYYGTVIHQVLDLCHRHFKGDLDNPPGELPTDSDIDTYFEQVAEQLRRHNIKPPKQAVADRAVQRIKTFNALEGPGLYRRVKDTEYRLESDRDQYILRGVVDLLAGDPEAPDDPAQMELWDYKGAENPGVTSPEMQDYVWQMCVYAELHKRKSGAYPAKAVLYFLNELNGNPKARPKRAVHEVDFNDDKIQDALEAFHNTAGLIIKGRHSKQWPLPEPGSVDEKTCDICDLRWNCEAAAKAYPTRLPIIS